jgi:hypothetical protein
LLHSIDINDTIPCSVWPCVETSAILFSYLPLSFKPLSARIVQYTGSMALVILEFSFIYLTVRPVEFSLARFFPSSPLAFIQRTIFPLEIALTIHLIVAELTLEDLTFRSYSPTEAMSLALTELTFINGAVREYFDSLTIRFATGLVNLSSELSARLSLFKPIHQ